MEIQRRYFAKLDKELKGKDRIQLMKILDKINKLELNEDKYLTTLINAI